MLRYRLHLFNLLGFKVQVDASWLVLAALITWSLASGWFPSRHPGLDESLYWMLGVGGALGLFASIVFHELCHSIVARRYGMSMRGITLFIFGGVAEMEDEPSTPRAEFLMAAAGPISSFGLAGLFYMVSSFVRLEGWPAAPRALLDYLALINVVLAAFNLIPAFPLDGGRMLRALLWQWKGDMRRATRITSGMGEGLGLALIILGLFRLLAGNMVGGLWMVLIGFFVRSAAEGSYQMLILRQTFSGEPVRKFMNPNPVSVPPELSIQELVQEQFYGHLFKMFPVVANGRAIGYVSTKQVKNVPIEDWPVRAVGDVMVAVSPENAVDPETDAMQAMTLMHRSGNSRLLVVKNGDLVGVVSLKDLLGLLSMKMDLEGDTRPHRGESPQRELLASGK